MTHTPMTPARPLQAPPAVVARYLAAADGQDTRALAGCFTTGGTVVDEGVIYRGHEEIVRWREELGARWEYTSTVTSTQAVDNHQFLVGVHVEGNFPGGQADLTYRFTVAGDALSSLSIVE